MTDNDKDWVTTKQLARSLGYRPQSVNLWLQKRGFPPGALKATKRQNMWHYPTIKAWRTIIEARKRNNCEASAEQPLVSVS
jgi:hypothetical protein